MRLTSSYGSPIIFVNDQINAMYKKRSGKLEGTGVTEIYYLWYQKLKNRFRTLY